MKIELEISNTQLEALDKDLTTFLSTLTDDQKLTLLSKYLEHQFQDIYKESRWGNPELTDFGREIVSQLRSKIADLYIENYYLNNEELKNELDKYVNDIKDSLPDIVKKSISEYIINNLFNSANQISYMVQNGIEHYVRETNNGEY